eukprot:1283297-Rhodomonas_salina.2
MSRARTAANSIEKTSIPGTSCTERGLGLRGRDDPFELPRRTGSSTPEIRTVLHEERGYHTLGQYHTGSSSPAYPSVCSSLVVAYGLSVLDIA